MLRHLLLVWLFLCGQGYGIAQVRSVSKSVPPAEKRLALVIGNSAYAGSPLPNAHHDAEDMAATLRSLGFEVILKHNLDQEGFENTLSDFTARLHSFAVGLFYFAGHGFEGSDNTNYLMSVEIREGLNETLAKKKSMSLTDVMASMKEANSRTNILLVDACRTNPFRSWGRTTQRGLGAVTAPRGTIVFFAASPGQEASENPSARNGLFTQELLPLLQTPNLELISIFKKTAQRVTAKNTNQMPYQAGFITDDFYFKRTEPEPPNTPTPKTEVSPPPNNTAHEPGKEVKFMDLPFADMVYVEGGTFKMGSNEGDDDEKPVHNVTVGSFMIGKYEVTQAQWRAVMGSDPPDLYNKNCDDCPVENISWNDIQEFLKKLNARTGGHYRLPTEAEWEYAARGGKHWQDGYTYAGGNDLKTVGWFADNYRASNYGSNGKTHPVGKKAANQLGLYDMSGNVWEWCSDWWGTYPSSTQTNPTGPATGTYRVLRGGSWDNAPNYARVANRINYSPDYRFNNYGFRVVSQLQ